MDPVSRQAFERDVRIPRDMRRRQVSSHAHKIGDDAGVHSIRLVDLPGAFMEARDAQGIQPVELDLSFGQQRRAGSQSIGQMPVVEGGGFQAHEQPIRSGRAQGAQDPLLQFVFPLRRVEEGTTFSERNSFVRFQLSHERLTGHVNTEVQGFHQTASRRQGWENSRSSEVPGIGSPRSLAEESAVTDPFVNASRDRFLPAEESIARTTGCAAACVVSIQVLPTGPADLGSVDNPQGDTAESSSARTSGQACSGILHEHSTGTSEICRRDLRSSRRPIASVMSNACVTEISFHPDFQQFDLAAARDVNTFTSDLLTSTPYC